MKKLILSMILFISFLFFLPPKADAQTRQECEKTRARASYNCLTGRTKCIYSCTDQTKDVSACDKTCSQSNDACEKQVEADYRVCLGTIKKDSENPPKTEASPEVQISTDCHEAFNKESNSCLKENTKCLSSCADKARGAMSLTVDGGKVNLECQRNVCDPSSEACNNKATANFKACLDAGKQPAASEAKQEAPVQDKKGVNIFKIFELFSKSLVNLATNKESSDPRQKETQPAVEEFSTNTKFGEQQTSQVNDWIMENNLITDPARLEQMARDKLDLELYGRTPQMTEEIVKKAREEWEAMFAKTNKESIAVVNGRGQFTTPEGFIVLTPQEKPVMMTYIDSTFINPNSETTQLNYTWGTSSGAVVSMPQQSEVKFLKPVQDEKTQEIKRMVKINKGELEVKVKNANQKDKFGVQGDFFDLFVIQTHFWVNQSQDKKLTVIGVYEGEVEVKTKDGKTIKVKPDGGKPGVVVVSRQLSIFKLAIGGVILAVITGGIVWLIKKKK